MVEYKGLKVNMPSLPKGSKKSQDAFYKVFMVIVMVVIVYVLYQVYKGYTGLKNLPSAVYESITNLPSNIYKTLSEEYDETVLNVFGERVDEYNAFVNEQPVLLDYGIKLGDVITPDVILKDAYQAGQTYEIQAGKESVETLQKINEMYGIFNPITAVEAIGQTVFGYSPFEAVQDFKSWYNSWW